MSKWNASEIRFGIKVIVGAAVWFYILKTLFTAIPLLHWLDDEYPTVWGFSFVLAFLSPIWFGERMEKKREDIERAAKEKSEVLEPKYKL